MVLTNQTNNQIITIILHAGGLKWHYHKNAAGVLYKQQCHMSPVTATVGRCVADTTINPVKTEKNIVSA